MPERSEERRKQLFEELDATGSAEAREELALSYAPLAEYFANRYKRGASDHDDLRQVAQLALLNAIDRFDLSRGAGFSTFAGRTIDGELKRYFRDKTWAVRVPRSLQEAGLAVRNAADDLALEQGRPATVTELAERTGLEIDVVVQALDVQSAAQAMSIDKPAAGEGQSVSDVLGSIDTNIERTDTSITIRSLLEQLPDRERRIVELRFYGEKTQQEIADEIGISQMHVSRLLRRALTMLRAELRH